MPANSKYPWEQPDYSQVVANNSSLMPVGMGQAGRDARKQRIAAGQARRAATPRMMTGTQFAPLSSMLAPPGVGSREPQFSTTPVPARPSTAFFSPPPPMPGVAAEIPANLTGGPNSLAESVLPPYPPRRMDPGVPLNASPLSPPVQQQPQPMNPQFAAAGQLADQIAARRNSGVGLMSGPSLYDIKQRDAAIQSRLANPPPGSLGDFTRGERGRTEEGRQAALAEMEQSYLSKPMNRGGGISGPTQLDREKRLNMLLGQRAEQESSQQVERLRSQQQNNTSRDEAINRQLAEQGYTPERLAQIASQEGRSLISRGGFDAAYLLDPGTVTQWTDSSGAQRSMTRGPEMSSERREARLASLPGRRLRDIQAPMERMDRVRAARQAMMANRDAVARQQFDMATNPMVNPMLVANSPYALSAVIQAQQDQREFASGAGRRKLEEQGLELQNQAAERMLDPEMLRQAQQDQAIQTLGSLPQEKWSSPLGRALQARAMGTVGNEPVAPQTALDAQSNAVALTPSITALIGGDPGQYTTASSLLDKVIQMQEQGIQVSPQDQEAIQQYVQSRSMYDTNFASNTGARPAVAAQGFGNWLMRQAERPFSPPQAPGSRPQAIPPQFLYPRMGG